MDYEVELACFVARDTILGETIDIGDAADAIFGVVLMNGQQSRSIYENVAYLWDTDWSARDIQVCEMAPLGPFQGKNFATTISPWVVTLDALAPFRAPLPRRLAPEFAYLNSEGSNQCLDIKLSVEIKSACMSYRFSL